MKSKIFLTAILVLSFSFLVGANTTQAAVTQSGPPGDYFHHNETVGGGAIIPLAKFMTVGDGATNLTKVGVIIRASSTMDAMNQLNGIELYKESGMEAGFQAPSQMNGDTFLTGLYGANIATGTLLLLQPTANNTLAAGNTEFFIVASTTQTANIRNGNGFDIQLQQDYASTSPATAGGVFTPFTSNFKVNLSQNAPIKISEIRAGATGNAGDEFLELYNGSEISVDLQRLPLNMHKFYADGSSTPVAITYYNKIIPGHGYFLITSQTGYGGTKPKDGFFATSTIDLFPYVNGGLSIATTSAKTATSSAIDRIGWGSQPNANAEVAATTTNLSADKSFERKAQVGSTEFTMAASGADYYKGNGFDGNDNRIDFVLSSTPDPQNNMSPKEFPFGGSEGDTVAPRIDGSYPGNNATNLPTDLSYIGFNFNEPIQNGTIASTAATTTVTLVPQGTAPAGVAAANLCASVTYNPMPGSYEPSVKCNLTPSSLSSNTTYIFEVGTSTASGIRDLAGNRLDQDSFQANTQSYQAIFTTGGSNQTQTNNTPPSISGSTPFPGSRVPTNITKFFITFSQTMNSSTLNANNIALYSVLATTRTAVSLSSATFSYNATTSVLTIGNLPSLADNTHYEIEVDGMDSASDTVGVKSANNVLMTSASYTIPFDTGSADTSAPQVIGIMPIQPGTVGVLVSAVNFTIVFDDHIDVSTATSGAVTLGIQGGAVLPADVSYNAASKELSLTSQNLLPAGQTLILTVKGGSLKNISGTYLGTDYTASFSTEASNTDTNAPSISFANADEFAVTITYNESVNSTDATNLANYSLKVGTASTTLSAMAGHTMTYDATTRTAKISGFYIPGSTAFTIITSNIRDISGNQMTSSSAAGTVMTTTQSGGMTAPGTSSGGMSGPPPSTTFSSGGGSGFAPPANIMVMNNFVSASSTYGFEIPISTQIPANGQVVITFPTNSDFGICCAATSSATMQMLNDFNRDINGPGVGTIGIKTITSNNIAKTITLTLDTATRSETFGTGTDTHDFLKFGITGIKNPSVSKGPDSSGYALDIKTKNSSGTILESNFSVNPVYIGGGNFGGVATTTIQGRVLSAYDSTTGLNGINIMLHSPMLGPMPRSISTSNSGNYSFTDLPANNDYWIFTEPVVSPSTVTGGGATTTGYFGIMEPTPIKATSTSIINRNITLTATTSAISLQVSVTAAANTFTASERIDIFAGGPGSFVNQTITPGTGALTYGATTTLSFQKASSTNGMWWVGMGPAMPKDGMMMGPPPQTNWVMPKPLELNISGCPQNCVLAEAGLPKTTHMFNISAADKVIYGVVKDGSGTVISGAMVYAYSTSQMMGGNSQSDSAGKFSINVTRGVYNVGAFYPGMGNSKEASVEVVSGTGASTVYYVDGSKTASTGQSGANPFIVAIKRPAYTITGRVTDGTNSMNVPVFAYRTDGPGHSDAMTDTSGNYTLYVDNGTWKVNTYISSYGQMTEQTVTISGANQSNINFVPSGSVTYWSVTGTVFESANSTIDSGEGIGGVMISARNSSTGAFYETKTGGSNDPNDTDSNKGVYTLRLPQLATTTGQYRLEVFKPGYGRVPLLNESLQAIPAFGIVATTTWNIRINSRQTVTVNIKDSSGNFVTVPKAYIDLFDMGSNYGNHAEIVNGTSTTILIPNGASTTIRAFIPSAPPSAISVGSDNVNSLVVGDVLKVDGAETIKVVVNTNLRTISGTVYHTSATSGNELKDVWIEVTDATNGMHYGVYATSTNGAYNIKIADGTYKITAIKSGYIMSPQSLTVSADATQNLIMTSANLTISGTVTAGGIAAPYAFVRGEKTGGGFGGTQADASGNYYLSVDAGTWRIFAASDKYREAGYSGNPITISASQSGINIALSTAANIRSEIVTSNTFKDNASGSFEDTTLNVKVSADANTICVSSGCSGSDSYITANETVNYPNTPTVNVIADKAKEISASSGGSTVTTLASGKKATIELTYTVAELAAEGIDTPSEIGRLQVSTVNEHSEWEGLNTIATYEDSNGDAVAVATTSSSIPGTVAKVSFSTTEATHFSPYALTDKNDPSAPGQPTGLTASQTSSGATSITLSWTANPVSDNVTGYYIYRDTASNVNSALLTNTSATTYTNSSLTVGATYYYRIGAYRGSLESQASSEASATVATSQGGGAVSIGASGGGGGVAPTVPPQTATPAVSATPATPTVSPATPATPSSAAKPSARAIAVSPAFNKTLKLGSANADVKRLQIILNSDPDTSIALKGVGSKGKETTKFGAATKNALQKFQVKYNIAKKGDKGYGVLGPATRAKIQELFKKAEPEKKEVKKAVKKTTVKKAVIKKTTVKKEVKKEVKKKTSLKKKTVVKKTAVKKKK